MNRLREVLSYARGQLALVAGSEASLEARLLLQHALTLTAEALIARGDTTLSAQEMADIEALLARRLAHEPVAQILGFRDFWKDRFIVAPEVLTPRPDSEILIETVLKLRPDHAQPYHILDLGTGSGCLVLSLLREYPNATGVAIDASPAALAVANRNAEQLGLAGRLAVHHGHWCKTLDKTQRFDIVVSNPPYIASEELAALMPEVRVYEPQCALDGGADGLDCYREIVSELAPHLARDALVAFEVGVGQAGFVHTMAVEHGYRMQQIAKDLAGIERVVALSL